MKAYIENMTRAWSLETASTLGIRKTTVRPGFVASLGIGPDKIARAIQGYRASADAVGFDSFGNVMQPAPRREKDVSSVGHVAERMDPYRQMMEWNARMIESAVEAAQPAHNVAKTVKDALMEPWMQPVSGASPSQWHRLFTAYAIRRCTPLGWMRYGDRWLATLCPSRYTSGRY